PLYVISERRLRENARLLKRALAEAWPGAVRLLPSLKANPTLTTGRLLNEEGLGCDTFGETEFVLARRAGVPPDLISVNGSSKSGRLVRDAIAAGARITIDSIGELDLVEAIALEGGQRAKVRLRLRPRIDQVETGSDLAAGISVRDASRAYRMGIPSDELVEAGRRALASQWLELLGLHVHLGRH